jgi:hypothetical protein
MIGPWSLPTQERTSRCCLCLSAGEMSAKARTDSSEVPFLATVSPTCITVAAMKYVCLNSTGDGPPGFHACHFDEMCEWVSNRHQTSLTGFPLGHFRALSGFYRLLNNVAPISTDTWTPRECTLYRKNTPISCSDSSSWEPGWRKFDENNGEPETLLPAFPVFTLLWLSRSTFAAVRRRNDGSQVTEMSVARRGSSIY